MYNNGENKYKLKLILLILIYHWNHISICPEMVQKSGKVIQRNAWLPILIVKHLNRSLQLQYVSISHYQA